MILSFILFKNLLLVVLFVAIWFIITSLFDHRPIRNYDYGLRLWFGVPGSGKTTMAAYLTKHSTAAKLPVLCNVDIKGAYKLDPFDLGEYDMSFGGVGAHVVYDEGSIDFDNRNYKEFIKSKRPLYFSLYRHMQNICDVFSQGVDVDKRIRDRATGMYYLMKLPARGVVCYRRINKILYINKEDKQMVDGFEFKGLPKIIFSRNLWKLFDSYDLSMCPSKQKNWEKW